VSGVPAPLRLDRRRLLLRKSGDLELRMAGVLLRARRADGAHIEDVVADLEVLNVLVALQGEYFGDRRTLCLPDR